MPSSHFATALQRTFLLLALLIFPALARAQSGRLAGQVVDQSTQAPISYASVGVLRQPLGTVADDQGRFSLDLAAGFENDSLRISLLGYAPLTIRIADLRRQLQQSGGKVRLQPAPTRLAEVRVRPGKTRRRVVGNSSSSNNVTAAFVINRLGNQIGQGMRLKRLSAVEQVSFHVAECTYDSLFYRVNVYQVQKDQPVKSLLTKPVYVRVLKGQIEDRLVVDLRPYNVWAKGDIVVALEMVKDLGPGTLQLSSSLMDGPLFVTDNSLNGWEKIRGFGVGIDATITEYF
ncbi:carboxypeptidase-like regulatory domain-containing protein [Hymenobacter sp. BT175]|uniref:carboxypeptidase-like regulatory domain-containing protein n=1 Tax=Hymenobacter translucens TaxID=2886507 RepID=UPI001D0F0DEC|nr:carboxypeptidase-like regulatory domain-containing protein [Hymenobacter translucens]MCC2547839.1 carboxypeptidase-like regulatory domain-containing protein [Hymenobacter translucens]